VHQALSPNGDGINDVFTIDGLTNYPDNKVTVMNRNGAVVYQAQGYDNSTKVFDGHSNINGVMQLPGTYFYSLEYKVGADVKRKTGFVILKY
jgi:gliding motility-associated-like protein